MFLLRHQVIRILLIFLVYFLCILTQRNYHNMVTELRNLRTRPIGPASDMKLLNNLMKTL